MLLSSNETHSNLTTSVCLASDEFHGDVALVEIFNRPLNELVNMGNYYPCKEANNSLFTPVLRFQNTWILRGEAKLSAYDIDDLCVVKIYPVVLYESGGYEKSEQHCISLGGEIPRAVDISEEILKISQGLLQTCRRNDDFVSWIYTNNSFERETYHRCQGLLLSGEVRYIACVKMLTCSMCLIQNVRVTLYGHGGKYFDNVFHLKVSMGELVFLGRENTTIKPTGNNWIISSPLHITEYKLYSKTLPIGRLVWSSNHVDYPDGRLLTLSRCKTFEFSCNDGMCISISHRCDDKFQCSDLSDEKNCDVIDLSASYNEFYEPPPRPGEKFPSTLHYDTEVYHMGTITTDEGKARMDLGITVSWFDPRLDFVNLKKNKKNYFLCGKVWKPSIRVVTGQGDGSVVATTFYEEQCYIYPKHQEPKRSMSDPWMSK